MEKVEFIDVKVVPYRLLNPQTVETILNKIYDLDGIVRVLVHGPSIPKEIPYGPAKGIKVNHKDRQVIKVKGEEVELKVKVGEIIVGVLCDDKMDENIGKIEKIMDENLPCSYQMWVGTYTKRDVTVTDWMKYGPKFEKKLDPRYIGLVDPNSKVKENVKLIK